MGFRLTVSNALLAVLSGPGVIFYSQVTTAQEIAQNRVRRLQGLEVGRQNSQYQECVDNMYASDINGDLSLSEDEYFLFIAKESEGAILVEDLSELPFPLVTNFVYGACFCSIIFQTPNCCVGAEASIDLNPEDSPFIEDNLITVCVSVKQAIGDEVGTSSPSATPPPIQTPTESPSVIFPEPTLSPTAITMSPTIASTTLAPVVPTPMPTPEELTCVNFQYGIGNSDGFTADDIYNEIGNTLKTGLIIATRNVTIETLNTTFPRDESRRRLSQRNLQRNHWPLKSSTKFNTFLAYRPYQLDRDHGFVAGSSGGTLQVTDLGRFRLVDQDIPLETEVIPLDDLKENTQVQRRMAYLPIWDATDYRRRLAYYSDEFQPVINSIFENPFCENVPECAVVDSTVCVLLEEGDDEAMVQMALLDGIEQAIQDGSFQAAIPPEHQLPGGENIGEST